MESMRARRSMTLPALAHNHDPRHCAPVPPAGDVRIGSQRALGHRRRLARDIDAVAPDVIERVTRRVCSVGRTVVLRFASATSRGRAARTRCRGRRRGLRGFWSRSLAWRSRTLPTTQPRNLRCSSIATTTALPVLSSTKCATRFGSAALTRAVLLGRDEGMYVLSLPD